MQIHVRFDSNLHWEKLPQIMVKHRETKKLIYIYFLLTGHGQAFTLVTLEFNVEIPDLLYFVFRLNYHHKPSNVKSKCQV